MKYTIIFILLIALSSCVTYKRCKEKFSTVVDSVTIQVPVEVKIPKDSISLRYITDTLKHTIIREQGRAKVFIHRDSIFTEVRVICKDSIIYHTKEIKVPVKQNFEPNKTNWALYAWIAVAAILVLILIVFKR